MMPGSLAQPGLAFAAGLLTVAAPCALPLLPVVLGATAAGGPGARPVYIALGFALSFTVLALVFGSIQHLLGLEQQTVRDAAALLLVAFGLSMVWPQAFQRLSGLAGGLLSRVSSLGDGTRPGWLGGLMVGASLGAVWTPCAGPVLATILTLVASQSNWSASAGLLGLYALGAALPMLGIAYGGQWALGKLRALSRHTHRLQQVMGLMVVAIGLLTLLQYDTSVTLWLSGFYPQLGGGL
jgi:cytochrome c-type biogenesis protein